MKTFATLLQREWMQHKLGWIIVVAAPLVIALIVLTIGHVQLNVDDSDITVKFERVPPLLLAMGGIFATAALTLALAWFFALVQTPGLARRDQQDRSIEFWLSLPTGHLPSLAAPMLAHLVLMPLAALLIGMVSGHVIALLLVSKAAGIGAWFALPWGTVLGATLALFARVAAGILLATLWLSPLILLVMVASAWLKRWGLPAVIVTLAVVGNILDKLYGIPIVIDTLRDLVRNAGLSLLGAGRNDMTIKRSTDIPEQLSLIPSWAAKDFGHALAMLADPLLLFALAVSAGCVALLVLRRRRGA
jgi:hypothetical protein